MKHSFHPMGRALCALLLGAALTLSPLAAQAAPRAENRSAKLALEVTDSAWVMDSGSIVHHGESTAMLNDDQIAQIYLGEMPV